MSVPLPLRAQGDGDETEGFRLPVPANSRPEDILPFLSAVPEGQQYLGSVQQVRHDTLPIKLSILMCAYNEERTIARAVREVLTADYPCEMELIIVDDGSTDATPALLTRVNDPRVIVHRHSGNRGKGAALLSAAALASGTHILPFDADLEYSPDDIARVVYPVMIGRCDVVYGARIFGFNTVYHSYKYAVGNRWLTRIANILFNSYLSDLHTCLKLIPMNMFKSLDLSELGFGLDTEVTALLLKAGVRPFEVPVSYYSRTHDQGKKINWRDAVACLSILVKVRLLRSPHPKTITAAPEAAERPGETAGAGWGAVRVLAVRDDSRPNAATS